MQELGYLDERLEPNYLKINERIGKLNVEEELKKDMIDGVRFCKQFSVSFIYICKIDYHFSFSYFSPTTFHLLFSN